MENAESDWYMPDDYEPDFTTPLPLTPGSQLASSAAPGRTTVSDNAALPLLRLEDWNERNQYDTTSPECIHYDIQWKVSQYLGQNTRASQVWKNSELNLVLAPGDYWEKTLKRTIDDFTDAKLGKDAYNCEAFNLTVSVERSRGHRLNKEIKELSDWEIVHAHLAGLSELCKNGKKITVDIDLSYRERESAKSKGKKKRSASDRQREQMEIEAGIYRDVYKSLRCDAANCRTGPHCFIDPEGNHHALIPYYIDKIVEHVKNGGKCDSPRDIPVPILHELYKKAAKAKSNEDAAPGGNQSGAAASSDRPGTSASTPESPVILRGKWDELQQEYVAFLEGQVNAGDWKEALRFAGTVARKHFFELEFCHAQPKFVSNKLVAAGVLPAIAAQWVRNIKKFAKQRL